MHKTVRDQYLNLNLQLNYNQLQIPGDIEHAIRIKLTIREKRKITLQLFTVDVCSADTPEDWYVVMDSHKYRFESIGKSADVCFKIFKVLNAA